MNLHMLRFYLLGASVLSTFLILCMGLFVFIKNIKGPLNRSFFIAIMGVTGWIMSAIHGFYCIYKTQPVLPFISFRLIWAFSIFIGFALLNFALYYPPVSKFINGKRELLLYLIPLILSAFFIIGNPDGVMRVDKEGTVTEYSVRRAMMRDITIQDGTLINVDIDIVRGALTYAPFLF
ncbi:MAG: hypothetical protein KKH98_10340, partial [Spirochaetes bacterium]|nr:hypothetical protein [Spirochaetota bacterium]